MLNFLNLLPFLIDTPPGTPPAEPPPGTPPAEPPPGTPGIMTPPETPPKVEGADWLPEDMRGNEGLKKFHAGGVKALADSYLNLEKAFQGKIPDDKSTDEERGAFWNQLGRPETAEGYTIKKPDNLPEGVEWSEDNVKAAAAVAHKAGLTQAQFEDLVAFDTQRTLNALADGEAGVKADIAATVAGLKKMWGASYDEKVQGASLATKTFAGDELWGKMEAAGLTSNPLVIELMAEVSKGLQEGRRVQGTPSADLTLTPEEAAKEQKAIATDKNHALFEAYNDRKHIDHKKAVEEFSRLSQLKRGKQPA